MTFTVVVLAGGRASRFGADKTRAMLGDRTVLDHLLSDIDDAAEVIVVGETRPVTRPVRWVLESPRYGGPVAGLAAALPEVRTDTFVLLAGDMPYGARPAPMLLAALERSGVDAVVAADSTGRNQPLQAAFRTAAARAVIPTDPADQGMRRAVLSRLAVLELPVDDDSVTWDVDTPADLRRIRRSAREADLVRYYDNESADRGDRDLPDGRVAARDEFVRQVLAEGRSSIIEVGTGPGRDAVALRAAGLTVKGVDLAPESVARCRAQGLDIQVGSALELPFLTGEFEAAYTASTLLHIADDDLDTALGELVRVVRPGSPVAIGVWGAPETREERWGGSSSYGPARFFALRSDADLRAALARHGTVERFDTWPGEDDLHYQWTILRTSGA